MLLFTTGSMYSHVTDTLVSVYTNIYSKLSVFNYVLHKGNALYHCKKYEEDTFAQLTLSLFAFIWDITGTYVLQDKKIIIVSKCDEMKIWTVVFLENPWNSVLWNPGSIFLSVELVSQPYTVMKNQYMVKYSCFQLQKDLLRLQKEYHYNSKIIQNGLMQFIHVHCALWVQRVITFNGY